MTNPAKTKAPRGTTVRIPADMKAELQAAAIYAGHSMNTEIMLRLQVAHTDQQFKLLRQENAEIRQMLRELLDKQ